VVVAEQLVALVVRAVAVEMARSVAALAVTVVVVATVALASAEPVMAVVA